ncbi:hypothetical protein BH10PSE7_BH10PSE7_43450 [soil metagenome]
MSTQLRILTSGNLNFLAYAQGILDGADVALKKTTSVTYVDQDTGRKLVIAGTGFDFQDTGPQAVPFGAQVAPIAGTVTSVTLMHGSVKVAEITGFAADLTFVAAVLQNGTFQTFLYTLEELQGPITFRGNNGKDVLPGTFGDDTYDGGRGGDTFNGDSGLDTVSYLSSTAGLTASLAKPSLNTGDAAHDIYHDIENLSGSKFRDHLTGNSSANGLIGAAGNDVLHGGGGDDSVQGSAGADTVYGDAGNDSLGGGKGADLLIGGAGADAFVFDTPFDGVDKVSTFDSLDGVFISRTGFNLGPRATFDFKSSNNPHATTDDPTFLYDKNDKNFSFDPDGTGAVKAVTLFHINGAGAVQESDIHLFFPA